MAEQDAPAAAPRLYSDPDTEIVFHLGFHCTDDEKLIWSLRRDKGRLESRHIAVPRRKFFTKTLREFTTERLKGARATLEEQEELFRRLIGTERADRLVFSYDSFLCAPDRVVGGGTLYLHAGLKALELRNLFPDCDMEFLCAVRNPVTFLSELYRRVDEPGLFEDFAAQIDLPNFRWSDVIARIRAEVPDVPIVVWANEDTPFVWGEILRQAAGLPKGEVMEGRFDVVRHILTEEGRTAFDAYVASKPDMGPQHASRVIEVFLGRFAQEDAIEETLLPPGFSDEAIETLTDLYEEDLERIAALPGVALIGA